MRLIGGEIELPSGLPAALTDSGRSSLRLLLQSEELRSRRFLLPDFLCASIIEVFDRVGIDYGFYRVGADFSLDHKLSKRNDFQALYVIDYFGCRPNLASLAAMDIAIIEDGVFLPWLEPRPEFRLWSGFNSFRKITAAPDGSIVSATFELPLHLIRNETAPFSVFKSRARRLKHDFLADVPAATEAEYLRLFQEGETLLNEQSGIYRISDLALLAVMKFWHDLPLSTVAAEKNLHRLRQLLPEWAMTLTPEHPSFLPLLVPERDRLRQTLAKQQVFLPVHWPAPAGQGNALYDRIISVPVDARYNVEDMSAVAALIRSCLQS